MNILRGRALASLILLLFTVPTTVLGATPSMGQPAYQRFFGYYNSTGDVAEASKVSNAVMIGYTGSDSLLIKKLTLAQSRGSKVIINVKSTFFPTGFTLSPDASAMFAHLVSVMAPYQSSIAGYYVFDEPYWNLQLAGNPVTNADLETSLEWVAKLLKAATPNIPSIIVFSKAEVDMSGFYTQLLPPDISAIGFDCYRAGCSANDLTSELAKMESSKYPAQKLILVPDANVPQNRKLNDVLDANTAQRVAWYQQQALSGPYASDILGILAFAYDGNYDPTGYSGWYGIDSLIQTKTALAGFYALFSSATPIPPTAVLVRWQNVDGTRQRTTTGIAMENGITTAGPILGHVFTSQPTLPSNEIEECESSSYGPGYFDYIISLNGTCTPAGYTRLRTLGWIYQTQQSGTIPLYSCWSAANKYHFGTLDRQCEGSGDTSPKTLGYILAPNPAATASISADNTTLPLGQSTVIHATFVPGSDDSLRNTDIDEVDPGSSTYTNKTYSGSQWGTAVRALLSYRFTPTAPGVYKFYTFVETSSYPFWSAVTPQMVTVTVSATNIPPSPTALSATCVNHTLTQSWGAVSGATSYHFYQKDTGTGYVWDSSLSSPSSQMNGMFGNYRWSVAACNSAGCSTPTIGTDFSCAVSVPPTGTITASQASLMVGQSAGISATLAAASGDTVVDTAINEVPSSSSEFGVAMTGPVKGTSLINPLNYTFIPTALGTYVFKAYAITKNYTNWQQPASVTVTVTPKVPLMPKSRSEFFTSLYRCILNRQPDAGGLSVWMNAASSTNLGSIYQAWFSSPEYLHDKISDQIFVNQIYACIHFRQPDQGGYDGILSALQGSRTTRAAIVTSAVTSSEFLTSQGPKLSAATGFALSSAKMSRDTLSELAALMTALQSILDSLRTR